MKAIHPSLTLTLLLAAVATGFGQPNITLRPTRQNEPASSGVGSHPRPVWGRQPLDAQNVISCPDLATDFWHFLSAECALIGEKQ